MKILLDENLPHRLRLLLVGHDVYTVAYMKWKGIENGELLGLAASSGFEAILAMDNGMPYEQTRLLCFVPWWYWKRRPMRWKTLNRSFRRYWSGSRRSLRKASFVSGDELGAGFHLAGLKDEKTKNP